MTKTLTRDVLSGGLLVAGGIAVVAYCSEKLPLGRTANIGPGLFPLALGVLLAGLGAVILIGGLMRPGLRPDIEWRAAGLVIGAATAFALIAPQLGIIPATLVASVLCSLAVAGGRWLQVALLSAALSLMAWLLFQLPQSFTPLFFRGPF